MIITIITITEFDNFFCFFRIFEFLITVIIIHLRKFEITKYVKKYKKSIMDGWGAMGSGR